MKKAFVELVLFIIVIFARIITLDNPSKVLAIWPKTPNILSIKLFGFSFDQEMKFSNNKTMIMSYISGLNSLFIGAEGVFVSKIQFKDNQFSYVLFLNKDANIDKEDITERMEIARALCPGWNFSEEYIYPEQFEEMRSGKGSFYGN